MKKDLVLIGTVSVIIIAFTLSLLNIYVFPNIYFQVDIYRNTEDEFQLELLQISENLGLNSSIFDSVNRTKIVTENPQLLILNITFMIQRVEAKESAAYDFNTVIFPKKIKFAYNGTIYGTANDSETYTNWINSDFDNGNGGNYFCFKNNTGDYEFYSRFSQTGLISYSVNNVIGNLTEMFEDTNRKPDFVVYQEVSYYENRGLLSEYSTDFQRIIFFDVFGSILFFLSTEGNWTVPLFT
ncbi:MAG: hypothetical protein ACTSX6_14030 [Candidatus Heimdallarchaeaceae archaeon]